MERTAGTLLGGRVRYSQFTTGYRTGIEPVLMAAAVPARAGETVLEAGCGAGAGLLCVLHRVPGVRGVGVEVEADMVGLARDNVIANGAAGEIVQADVLVRPWAERVQHVMANPPWHAPGGTASPDAKRRLALQGHAADWIVPLAAMLTPRGTLTLVVPAASCAAAMASLREVGLWRMVVFPFWPRQGAEAKLLLLQARRGAEGCRVVPGLVLHGAGSGYTREAEAILRDGGGMTLPG